MSIITAAVTTIAATAGAKALGLTDSGKSSSVDRPAWLDNGLQATLGNLQNSPVPYLNPDNLTAGLNPYMMEALAQAGTYSQGAGQNQVDLMNLMGLQQAGTSDKMQALADMQAGYGDMALSGSGSWLLNELANAMGGGPQGSQGGGGGGGSSMSYYGGGGGGGGGGGSRDITLGGDLKFKYDQGTFDQSYNNLIGSTQGAFDAWANKTKTNNLFQNLPGLKIGSQLLGGANTKVGQNASLLDAMTNQQIMDYGGEMQRWASGQADANAMQAGLGNQQTAYGVYNTDVQAATSRANAAMSAAASRANAAMSANASKYNALVGAASNMFGYGAGLMGDASTSLANANTGYGNAANTFNGANDAATNNMNTSLAAGNYLQQYDQAALDRWNDANIFNTSQPFNMNLNMFNAMNGTPVGSTTTESPSFLSSMGQMGTMAGMFGIPGFG